jgi:phosphatidylglycerophosphate synthase
MTTALLSRIREGYRRTRKPNDIFWNRFVARPLAAPLVVALERTRVTPNQVTLLSLLVFLVSASLLVLLPGPRGLLAAVIVLELSYVLDCVDGQLARLRGSSSPIGAHFDFLMDELKAFVLVGVVAGRLWSDSGDDRFLLEGVAALVAVASGISLTTFVRRPEYAAATGARVSQGSGDYGEGFAAKPAAGASASPLRQLVRLAERLGGFLAHYPSYLLFVAIADRLDLFLHTYFAVHAAYAARALLGVTWKLGRSAR